MVKAVLPDIEIKDEDVVEEVHEEKEEILESNIGNVNDTEKESPFVNETPDKNISIEKTEPDLEVVEPEISLTSLTKKALFDKCKSRGIKRYSKLSKPNLIKLLNGEEIPEKKKLIEKTEPVLEVTKPKKKEKKKRVVEVVEVVEESESSEEEEVRVVKKIVKKKKKKNKEYLRNTLEKEVPNEKRIKKKSSKRKELREREPPERKLPPRDLPEYNPFKNMYNID